MEELNYALPSSHSRRVGRPSGGDVIGMNAPQPPPPRGVDRQLGNILSGRGDDERSEISSVSIPSLSVSERRAVSILHNNRIGSLGSGGIGIGGDVGGSGLTVRPYIPMVVDRDDIARSELGVGSSVRDGSLTEVHTARTSELPSKHTVHVQGTGIDSRRFRAMPRRVVDRRFRKTKVEVKSGDWVVRQVLAAEHFQR